MLPDTLTLSVDPLNDSNPANEGWDRIEEGQNRSIYAGPDHSLVAPQKLTLTRNVPKKSGTFLGVAKSGMKISEDISVDTSETSVEVSAPLIGAVSFSIPIGATAAEAMLLRQRLIALLDNDGFMVLLSEKLVI
jgi:hypothetical protein